MSTDKSNSVFATLCSPQGVPTLLVAAVGVTASLAIFFAAYFLELRSIRESFDSLADDRFHACDTMFGESSKLLGFMDNVFLVGPKATSPEFPEYVRSLKAFLEGDLSRHLSVHGITWVPRVPYAERAAYERAAQAAFDPVYRIDGKSSADKKANGKREDSYPSFLSLGKTTLRDHPGKDLSRDPATWAVMQEACESGEAVATAPIEMSSDSKDRLGYRVFQPLYSNGNAKTAEQRRQACIGFMCLDLDIGVMVDNALRETKPVGIELLVYDGANGNRVAVYRHASRLRSADGNKTGQDETGGLKSPDTSEFFGRKVLLLSQATAAFWASHPIWQPWVVLCAGLALTLAMAAHRYNVTLRSSVIERVVSSRLAAIQNEAARRRA